MASQLLGIKTRFTNDLGSPLVGGQVYTYFAGTSTNQDSYSDAALTVPNTNPVILDDTGSADIFLKGAYRIRVFDKSGRFIEEQDNVTQAANGLDATILTERVNVIDSDLSKVKSDTGITVTPKNGTLPIDQSVKNAQTISMVEYGAVGDGVTDDTAAFELLEANVTNREIDLQGKTYKVDQVPTGNTYKSGWFSVANNIIKSISDMAETTKVVPLISADNVDTYNLRYSLVRGNSTGGINSIPQGVAYDAKNERLYEVSTGTTDGRGYSLNIFDASTTGELTDYFVNRSMHFGHQGVGVHYDSVTGAPVLWMSGNYNYTPSTGHLATAYSKVRLTDTDYITDGITTFKLFEDTTRTQSVTPTVSSCGTYLIAKNSIVNGAVIRLFDVVSMWENRQTTTDYSNKYIHEFVIDVPPNLALQGMACDGAYVYILLAEYGFNENAYVLITTLQGQAVDKVNVYNVGLAQAIVDSPNPEAKDGVKEYEGLLIFNEAGKQSLGIVLGTTYNKENDKKNCYIYDIGNISGTVGLKRGVVSTGAPLLHSAAPIKRPYNFGVLGNTQATTFYWTVHPDRKGTLTNNGNPIFGSAGLTGGIQLLSNGSEGMSNLLLARTDSGSTGARIVFHKSRSETNNDKDIAPVGTSELGSLFFNGDATTKHAIGAAIIVSGTVVGDTLGSIIAFTVDYAAPSAKTYRMSAKTFTTLSDGLVDIGASGSSFKNIYLTNSPIVSSDERLKQDFRNLKAAEKKAAIEIKESICLYKMKGSVEEKGDGARWHVGVKAQQIVSIMESHGLEPFDYGFICYDEWDALDAEIDDDGNEVQAAREAGDKYAIRYDELSMFILAAI